MRMGSKRRYKEWYDEWNPGNARKFLKRHTVRLDRIEDRLEIDEQYTDYRYGVDPD